MPTHTLTVLGKEITFLIVLGATHSVVKSDMFKSDMFDTHPTMSEGVVRSLLDSGNTVVENFMTP